MLELRYSDYLDRVHGGWIGKCIGGAVGTAMENNKSLMHYTLDNVFPGEIPANDDLDLQILWLQDILAAHAEQTGSDVAAGLLGDWEAAQRRFCKIMPRDYRRVLDAIALARSEGRNVDEAIMEASRG